MERGNNSINAYVPVLILGCYPVFLSLLTWSLFDWYTLHLGTALCLCLGLANNRMWTRFCVAYSLLFSSLFDFYTLHLLNCLIFVSLVLNRGFSVCVWLSRYLLPLFCRGEVTLIAREKPFPRPIDSLFIHCIFYNGLFFVSCVDAWFVEVKLTSDVLIPCRLFLSGVFLIGILHNAPFYFFIFGLVFGS